jgi:hypothetical protein
MPVSVLQRAQQSGGAPSNLTTGAYRVIPWTQHQKELNQGADQIGLRLYELNQGVTLAKHSQALILPTVAFHTRSDEEHAALTAQNIEAQSWTVTGRLNKRASLGKPLSSDLANRRK